MKLLFISDNSVGGGGGPYTSSPELNV